MATRRTSRKTARQRRSPAHSPATHSLYRRKLRCEPLEDRRLLATVTVTTALDTVDFSDGLTSLREALFATNLVAGPDIIDFAPALTAGGPATILLTQGELAITDNLTIVGPGANHLTIDASGNDPTPDQDNGDGSRIFNIDDGNNANVLDVSISGLVLTGGDVQREGGAVRSFENLSVISSGIKGNFVRSSDGGGGIFEKFGTLSLIGSSITQNTASSGGGVHAENAAVVIENSTIAQNSASTGGGIYVENATLSVVDSTITQNAMGGGLASSQSQVTISASRISENTSQQGGGIRAFGGQLTIVNSSIVRNKMFLPGGTGAGGGIDLTSVALTLTDSEVSENVFAQGAGIYSIGPGSSVTVLRSNIVGNVQSLQLQESRGAGLHVMGGPVSVIDSVISGNQGGAGLGVNGSPAVTIRNSELSNNQFAGAYLSVGAATITDTVANDNGAQGLFARTSGANITIERSTASGNRTGIGVSAFGTSNITISDATVSANESGGINLSAGGASSSILVTRSIVAGNALGGGIQLTATGGAKATIEDSQIAGNSSLGLLDQGGGISATGQVVVRNCVISGNSTLAGGAGIFSRQGSLTLISSTITGNAATTRGGGVLVSAASGASIIDCLISQNSADSGGGLYADGVAPDGVRIERTTISANTAHGNRSGGHGGGVYSSLANVSVIDSTIDNNTALHEGGGIYQGINQLTVERSTVSNNEAESGGGISAGFFVINNSTIHNNSADAGGGVFGSGRITQSTISGNLAVVGAGIHTRFLQIAHSTVAFNQATSAGAGIFLASSNLQLNHTIIASNTAPFPGTGGDISALVGSTITARYSLIGNSFGSGLTPAPVGSPDTNGNLIGGTSFTTDIDPQLAPLAENGGPTKTHLLLANSPALNAGDPAASAGESGIPLLDQRGEPFTRVFGGRIDIGAIERQDFGQALQLVVDTLNDEVDGNYSTGDLSLREAIGLANANADYVDTITFSQTLSGGTILLTKGELLVTESVLIHGLGAAQLTVDASGNDPTPDVDSGDGSRIFAAYEAALPPIQLSIRDLTLTGGDATGDGGAILVEGMFENDHGLSLHDVRIVENHASGNGGGVHVRGRSLEITDSNISHNSATGDGGGLSMLMFTSDLPTITNSTLAHNSARNGGGMHSAGSSASNRFTLSGSTIRDNVASASGGGVMADGSATIIDSLVTGNSANSGGGLNAYILTARTSVISGNTAATGGGIRSRYLTVADCTISENAALQSGGGIWNSTRTRITSTTIADNEAGADGGGIYLSGSRDVEIIGSAILRNLAAGNGGGIHLNSLIDDLNVDFLMDACTIAENTTGNNGGGLSFGSISNRVSAHILNSTVSDNHAVGDGGGVRIQSILFDAVVLFRQCTISGNDAAGSGGGMRATVNLDGRLDLVHSTIARNTAAVQGGGLSASGSSSTSSPSSTRVQSTIIADNSAPVGRDLALATGTPLVVTYSLIGDNAGSPLIEAPGGSPDASGNLIGGPVGGGIDPLLGPLADNGGPTLTHALLSNSPALNAGDPLVVAGQNGIPVYDQRGLPFTRISGGRIDIGAFESQPASGDFNFDGSVDAADYVLWRKMLTSTYPAGYDVWTTDFGADAGGGGSGQNVQEARSVETATLVATFDSTVNESAPESPQAEAFKFLDADVTKSIPRAAGSLAKPRFAVAAPISAYRSYRPLIELLAPNHTLWVPAAYTDADTPLENNDTRSDSNDAFDTVFDLLGAPSGKTALARAKP
jgi:hypothetical protein